MNAALDSFRLDLPPEWAALPTASDEVAPFIEASSVKQLLEAAKPSDRRQIENFLQRLVNEMQSQRCFAAAVYAELVTEDDAALQGDATASTDTTTQELGIISAGCLVQHLSADALESAASLSPEVLLAAISMRDPNAVSYEELEVPAIVELTAGPAVHLLRLQPGLSQGEKVFSETFMVPIAPEHEHVFVLQFSTPCTDLVNEFSAIFLAIANTFMVYREGEPTLA